MFTPCAAICINGGMDDGTFMRSYFLKQIFTAASLIGWLVGGAVASPPPPGSSQTAVQTSPIIVTPVFSSTPPLVYPVTSSSPPSVNPMFSAGPPLYVPPQTQPVYLSGNNGFGGFFNLGNVFTARPGGVFFAEARSQPALRREVPLSPELPGGRAIRRRSGRRA